MKKCKYWILFISILAIVLGCSVIRRSGEIEKTDNASKAESMVQKEVISAFDKEIESTQFQYQGTGDAASKEKILTAEELAFFNDILFNQGQAGLFNYFLSCSFGDSGEINLFTVFSNMHHLSLSVGDQEKRNILDRDCSLLDNKVDIKKVAVSDMNAVLIGCLGKSLGEMRGTGLEHFIQSPDCEYYYYAIAPYFCYSLPTVKFLYGERCGTIIRLYYDPEDTYMSGSDATSLACVTLKNTDGGYILVSNLFVPVESYLDRKPEVVIPLSSANPWDAPSIRCINHQNDLKYCYGRVDFKDLTVCVYESKDGNNYLAVVNDELAWNVNVFRTLPHNVFDVGFSIEGYDNLLGETGLKITYTQKGVSIYEYYYLTQDGIRLLVRGDSKSKVVDMDIDHQNELIVYNNGMPTIFKRVDNVLRCVNVGLIVDEGVKGDNEIRFGGIDASNRNVPLYVRKRSMKDADYEVTFNIFVFKDSLMIYA